MRAFKTSRAAPEQFFISTKSFVPSKFKALLLVVAGNASLVTVTVKLHVAFGTTPLLAVTSTVVVPTGKAYGEVMVVAPILYVSVDVGQPTVAANV